MQQDESLLIMLPQRHRKFTRDTGSSLHSAGFVQETNSPGKPPPLAIRSPLAIRVKDNILAQAERDLLDWLCARTPDAITPDRLTGFGAAGAAVVFLGYAATPFHPAFSGWRRLASSCTGLAIRSTEASPGTAASSGRAMAIFLIFPSM